MTEPTLPVAEFRARCLALIDRVSERGESIAITRHGQVIARLVPASEEGARPWTVLRGRGRWTGDRYAPVVGVDEVESLR